MGFLLATLLQVLTMFYVNTIISACLSAGVGVYMWAMSMATDIKNNLVSINNTAKCKRKRPTLLKLLKATVGFHSTTQKFSVEALRLSFVSRSNTYFSFRLVHRTSDVAYLLFMVLMIWSIRFTLFTFSIHFSYFIFLLVNLFVLIVRYVGRCSS